MKRMIILAILSLSLALFLIVWGFGADRDIRPPAAAPRALLLVENDTGTYLMQLRKGLQEAVQERNGRLSVQRLSDMGPDDMPALADEYAVLYLLSDQALIYLDSLRKTGLPLVILGQEIRGESCVLPDEEGGGRLAGEHLAKILKSDSLSVVLDETDPANALRQKGLRTGLGKSAYQTYTYGEFSKQKLDTSPLVAALSQRALSKVMGLRQEDGAAVFGFDAEDSRLALMEEGRLAGVITADPYALGYIAGSLLDEIRQGIFKPSLHYSPMRLVTLETLYDADNVKLMFPLLY